MNLLRIQNKELFHISFARNLEGTWSPKLPDGPGYGDTSLSEPEFPRISVGPTVGHCFWAIYPNISKFFEEHNLPHIDMCVYTPVMERGVKVLSNEEIVKRKLVHDAHVTKESYILSEVRMIKHSEIRIYNCTKNKEIWYYPFDDKKQKKRFLSHEVDIEFLDDKPRAVTLDQPRHRRRFWDWANIFLPF